MSKRQIERKPIRYVCTNVQTRKDYLENAMQIIYAKGILVEQCSNCNHISEEEHEVFDNCYRCDNNLCNKCIKNSILIECKDGDDSFNYICHGCSRAKDINNKYEKNGKTNRFICPDETSLTLQISIALDIIHRHNINIITCQGCKSMDDIDDTELAGAFSGYESKCMLCAGTLCDYCVNNSLSFDENYYDCDFICSTCSRKKNNNLKKIK